ncbi:uncharacterized protein MONOS_9964 [Monocercomonoides exilis]|uniref:uncharacterized protein n=1 Tax=Monocercomonoides exilis TaxID=2049356 RepID=UPI00355A935A|nr:hypothetical protein MONOS_9964 [Monocercomonoides exilis]|eukprot:MONOS_9964.1-p1 / transcript=MONOS_9964.1 / gene=MONOS_9964 / organism=Monocercomonoides_exilis_PA203 / gene_product=unspecified product / transcript_product=unspecified product / location=Mono_scaffold00432:5698-5931(+) / protein_length=78 / sequence_SO=supercontig / SO=protein_coding / is_pseudo=false
MGCARVPSHPAERGVLDAADELEPVSSDGEWTGCGGEAGWDPTARRVADVGGVGNAVKVTGDFCKGRLWKRNEEKGA